MANRPVVDRREVERIARLAHITLDNEEKEALAVDLGAILAYVRKLEELDLTFVEPHACNQSTRLRDDEVAAGLPVECALRGAPQRVGDNFGVPKVIE